MGCNGKTDLTCCPKFQIPWCYVGLSQTEEQDANEEIKQQEISEETQKQETGKEDQKAIEEAYPGCKGVCKKPGSALCFAKNAFTSIDVGPSCGNINSAWGCAPVGDITKAGSCRLCNGKTDLKCCPKFQIPWCYVSPPR